MGLVIAFKAYDLEEKKFMGLVMRIGGDWGSSFGKMTDLFKDY